MTSLNAALRQNRPRWRTNPKTAPSTTPERIADVLIGLRKEEGYCRFPLRRGGRSSTTVEPLKLLYHKSTRIDTNSAGRSAPVFVSTREHSWLTALPCLPENSWKGLRWHPPLAAVVADRYVNAIDLQQLKKPGVFGEPHAFISHEDHHRISRCTSGLHRAGYVLRVIALRNHDARLLIRHNRSSFPARCVTRGSALCQNRINKKVFLRQEKISGKRRRMNKKMSRADSFCPAHGTVGSHKTSGA